MAEKLVTFTAILGQQAAIEWLRAAWEGQRLPHALIFAGPAGVGKATTARALVTLFLCHKPKDETPCGKCESCRAMQAGVHPDFAVVYRQLIRLEKATQKARDLSVEVIRQFLIEPSNLKASLGHGRAFVVEESELMNAYAQNALLKTLEEPSGRQAIILLADQPEALLPTIRSRSQLLRFAPLDEQVVRVELIKRGQSKQAAADAARVAAGSLGMALRWLQDGVIAGAAELIGQIDAMMSSRRAALPELLKKLTDSYVERQLARDSLASKEQATREALATYFRIAADHFRRRLTELEEPEQIEQVCAAIDAIALSEQYVDSNVNAPLVMQQLSSALERTFALQPVSK